MKILAFAGSNSSASINKKLVKHVLKYFNEDIIETIDINDYEMPIYSSDREQNSGIPESAVKFAEKIDASDLIILSLAEHNGAYSTAFKNIFDWVSRMADRKVFGNKYMFLLSTSPGERGGASVLEIAKNNFPHQGAIITETFSLPSFYDNFDDKAGITNKELKDRLDSKIFAMKNKLSDLGMLK